MTVLYPRPTHSLRSFLEDCLLPTNRVRISAERGSPSTTEILGIYSFSISLEQSADITV